MLLFTKKKSKVLLEKKYLFLIVYGLESFETHNWIFRRIDLYTDIFPEECLYLSVRYVIGQFETSFPAFLIFRLCCTKENFFKNY